MNTKQSSRVFVGVFATFSALSVAAPFTVEHYTFVGPGTWEWDTANEGTEYTVVENPPDSNNWDFTLIDPNNVQWNIKAHDPAVDSINQITETAGGAFFTVIVGDAGGRLPSSGPYDHALTEPMSPGCKNFNGVMSPSGDGTMKLVVIASGSINGTIDVEEAARLRAVNITADIENDATAVKPINILTTGNFSGSYLSWGAKLQSLISPRFTGLVDIRGEIGRIETTSQPISGTIFGDTFEPIASNPQAGVFSPSGTSDMVLDILGDMPAQISIDGDFIGSLTIGGDLIGHASHATQGVVSIDGRLLSSGNVSILGDMKSNSKLRIGTPTTGTAVELAGFVDVLGKVDAGAQIDIDGDMDGFMEFGDLEGNVEIAGEVGDTAIIWMSDLLDGPGGVEELDITDDLAGQIIINKSNDQSVWSGTIEVGGRRFSTNPANANDPAYVGPRYSFDGAGFGGGAIGLTRFDFHEYESIPENGESAAGAISTARIMYYGPIDEIDNNSGQSPVYVERAPALMQLPWGCTTPCDTVPGVDCGDGMEWVDISEHFGVSISGRAVDVSGPFKVGYRYRIRSRACPDDRLVCWGVATSPDCSASSEYPDVMGHNAPLIAGCNDDDNYVFIIPPAMPLDLSGNGEVGAEDIVAWTNTPTDVDFSETVDVIDLMTLSEAVGE